MRLKSAQILINCLAGKPILSFGTFISICIFLHDLKLFFPFLLPHTLRFYKFVCVVEISFKTCFFSVEVNPSICFHHPSLLIFLQILVIFFVSKIVRKGQNVPLDLGQSFFCESVTLFFCCCLLTYSVQHHFVKKRNYNLFCLITTPLLLKDFSSTMTGKKSELVFGFPGEKTSNSRQKKLC